MIPAASVSTVDDERALLVRFEQLLEREEAAIVAHEVAALAAIAEEREHLTNLLAEAARRRRASPTAIEADIADMYRRLRERHEVRGRVVRRHAEHNNRAIGVLAQAAGRGGLYNADGFRVEAVRADLIRSGPIARVPRVAQQTVDRRIADLVGDDPAFPHQRLERETQSQQQSRRRGVARIDVRFETPQRERAEGEIDPLRPSPRPSARDPSASDAGCSRPRRGRSRGRCDAGCSNRRAFGRRVRRGRSEPRCRRRAPAGRARARPTRWPGRSTRPNSSSASPPDPNGSRRTRAHRRARAVEAAIAASSASARAARRRSCHSSCPSSAIIVFRRPQDKRSARPRRTHSFYDRTLLPGPRPCPHCRSTRSPA